MARRNLEPETNAPLALYRSVAAGGGGDARRGSQATRLQEM